jgi:hypothetical protein
MMRKFAATARERRRISGGGYHLRALAQRVEVADGDVRIMGSKSDLSIADACRHPGLKIGDYRRSQFCSEMASRAGFEPALPP